MQKLRDKENFELTENAILNKTTSHITSSNITKMKSESHSEATDLYTAKLTV